MLALVVMITDTICLCWDGAQKQMRKIAKQNAAKIIRTARFEVMHDARKEAYGRLSA